MPETTRLLWYILIIGVVGVGALLSGILAARLVKRWLHGAPPGEPFTVQDLREMHQRGEITEQEYQAMRTKIISRLAIAPSPQDREPSPGDAAAEQRQSEANSDPPVAEDS
jgi:hypothetical protein